ncbi:MAG: xanthine dehydrogenase family protein [Actinomycetia bacterium]|nr:xanthine dehydrogenase family protein [Actinomycetes bacterium]
MSILGNEVVRREDPGFLSGGATYIADLDLPGAATVLYVLSPMAHARIESIDVSGAAGATGVVGVFTATDLDIGPLPAANPAFNPGHTRPLLADGVVRYAGEPVAVIVAEDQAAAEDAADLVMVDYEPLPVLLDPEAAIGSETLLFPESGSNVVCEIGDDETRDADFSDCEVVVEGRTVNQRIAAAPLEGRAGASMWDTDGRLHHWSACQGAHPQQAFMMQVYGLAPEKVRIIVPDVGGGFGSKGRAHAEELLLPWLAARVGRPVRWSEGRGHNLVGLGHGRGQVQYLKIGGDGDGRVKAFELRVVQEGGAYPLIGSFLPTGTRRMMCGVYDIGSVGYRATSVLTNTTPTTAYRGAGRPEAAAAVERAMDLFAAEIGMDPAEVRRRNLVAPFDNGHTTAIGTLYDTGNYEESLNRALAAVGYDDLRVEQARRRQAGDRVQLGVGVAVYVEITAGANREEYGSIELRGDGSAVVRTGSTPTGQGHETAWAMVVQERTGIAMDRVEVRWGDTDMVPSSQFTGGSRSVQLAGAAVWDASDKLVEQARARAADLLEAAVEDIEFDATHGQFHVVGTPAVALDWAAIGSALELDDPFEAVSDYVSERPSYPFGTHVSVVEVDTETGGVTPVRHLSCDDAGIILNRLLFAGQIHGGVASGIAQALLEEVRYDPEGNPLTTSFADYGIPSAAELPSFERVEMETPTPLNPIGAKGIGEAGSVGATPAVQSAVVDAVSHLGVRHIDMPCTAEKVWRAIEATSGGEGS